MGDGKKLLEAIGVGGLVAMGSAALGGEGAELRFAVIKNRIKQAR